MNGMNTRISRFQLAVGIAAATLATLSAAGGDKDVEVRSVIIRGGPSVIAFTGDQDHRMEIRVENGEISVKLNGKEIPQARIRTKDGRITIIDEDGNELDSFTLHVDLDDMPFAIGLGQDWPKLLERGWSGVSVEPQPTVMLGIQMGEPGEALRRHLRLEPATTTMISGLYEGLPADAAGLEQFDIIVAVNGKEPSDPQSIRKILADKEPDDSVTFTIIREGRTRESPPCLGGGKADK